MKYFQECIRLVYRLTFPLLWVGLRILGKNIEAVRCIIVYGDRILLIRHTYGNREKWFVPGGKVKIGEDTAVAAAREVREEVGITVEPIGIGAFSFVSGGVQITNHGYWAAVASETIDFDPVEIREAKWFDLDALPVMSDGIAELIDMYHVEAEQKS